MKVALSLCLQQADGSSFFRDLDAWMNACGTALLSNPTKPSCPPELPQSVLVPYLEYDRYAQADYRATTLALWQKDQSARQSMVSHSVVLSCIVT